MQIHIKPKHVKPMPSYLDSNSSLDLNGESRRSGSNEEAEDKG